MAFVMEVDGGNVPNVDWSVGARGVNRRDDVMLVQTLLNLLCHDPLHAAVPNHPDQPLNGSEGPLTVDGYWGPRTHQAVLNFEAYCVKYLGGANDGLLDPIPASFRKARQGGYFKLFDLVGLVNTGLTAKSGTRTAFWEYLRRDAPPLLQTALKCKRKQAAQYAYKPPTLPKDRTPHHHQFDIVPY
jgi:peptidoglycan hydrolase-like protein with peptidoglycan-binding domain